SRHSASCACHRCHRDQGPQDSLAPDVVAARGVQVAEPRDGRRVHCGQRSHANEVVSLRIEARSFEVVLVYLGQRMNCAEVAFGQVFQPGFGIGDLGAHKHPPGVLVCWRAQWQLPAPRTLWLGFRKDNQQFAELRALPVTCLEPTLPWREALGAIRTRQIERRRLSYLRRGSNASRTALPNRLVASTARKINTPGKMTSQAEW